MAIPLRAGLRGLGLLIAIAAIAHPASARRKAPPVTPDVQLVQGGAVQVDGKPFFPIGLYSSGSAPPRGFSYAEIAEAGFNLVTAPFEQSALDELNRHGLKAILYLGPALDISLESNRAILQKAVRDFANHPAMLVWESINEPSWTYQDYTKNRVSAEGLAAGHAYLKTLDPHHLILATHAPHQLVKTIAHYSKGVDAISPAFYPIIPPNLPKTYGRDKYGFHGDLPNQSASAVGEYTDKMRKVVGWNRSVWTTLQAFSWSFSDKENLKDYLLFPSYAETRFMAFDAIVHGANGLLFWGAHHINSTSSFWRDLSRVTKELKEMSPVFLSPTIKSNVAIDYIELGYSNDSSIEFLRKTYAGVNYLIATNTSRYPAKVVFRNVFGAQVPTSVRVADENRKVSTEQGTFTDSFEELGVHVYVW